MDTAAGSGRATVLSQAITFIRRYRGTWWLSTEAGWLPIPPPAAPALDQHAQRLQHPAIRRSADRAAIRAVIELARQATSPLDESCLTQHRSTSQLTGECTAFAQIWSWRYVKSDAIFMRKSGWWFWTLRPEAGLVPPVS